LCEGPSVEVLVKLKEIISQNVSGSGLSKRREEGKEEAETYPPGSTVLAITVFMVFNL
jgi:hypothetical protein